MLLHPRPGRERRVHEQHHRHPEESERVEAREVQGGTGLESGSPDLLCRPPGRAHSQLDGSATSSWYSSSTFTDQTSCAAPKMFSTLSMAVYMEWSWLL